MKLQKCNNFENANNLSMRDKCTPDAIREEVLFFQTRQGTIQDGAHFVRVRYAKLHFPVHHPVVHSYIYCMGCWIYFEVQNQCVLQVIVLENSGVVLDLHVLVSTLFKSAWL